MSSGIGVDTGLEAMIVMGGGVWPEAVEAARKSASAAAAAASLGRCMLRFPDYRAFSSPGISRFSDCHLVSHSVSRAAASHRGLLMPLFSHLACPPYLIGLAEAEMRACARALWVNIW